VWPVVRKITYITPYENTIPVAKKTANIIKNLVKWNGLDVKTVTLIGHSLGAHTAGDTGMNLQRDQEVGEKPGKIIGMDPAGPGYRGITVPVADILNDGKNNDNDNSDKDRRLDHTDADFVVAIHTDTDWLGNPNQLGHVDFYPNGGKDQPGCLTIVCDHGSSYKYVIESIESKTKFLATACESYSNYKDCECNNVLYPQLPMGYFTPKQTTVDGIGKYYFKRYFLRTNKKTPRSKS